MRKKLIVLSIDSLFDEDMELLKTLPNFKKILEQGSYVKGGMRSVYPSLPTQPTLQLLPEPGLCTMGFFTMKNWMWEIRPRIGTGITKI